MKKFTKLAFALLVSGVATAAQAEQVAIAITGQVKSVIGNAATVNSHVHIGDTVTGYYVIDTDSADNNPSPLQGVYPHAGPEQGLVVEIDGVQFSRDPAAVDFTVSLNNDLWGPGRGDSALLESKRNLFSPGVPAALSHMTVSLYERSATVLTSDALSADALLAPQWYASQPVPFAQSAALRIYGSDGGGTKFQIDAQITGAQRIALP